MVEQIAANFLDGHTYRKKEVCGLIYFLVFKFHVICLEFKTWKDMNLVTLLVNPYEGHIYIYVFIFDRKTSFIQILN